MFFYFSCIWANIVHVFNSISVILRSCAFFLWRTLACLAVKGRPNDMYICLMQNSNKEVLMAISV